MTKTVRAKDSAFKGQRLQEPYGYSVKRAIGKAADKAVAGRPSDDLFRAGAIALTLLLNPLRQGALPGGHAGSTLCRPALQRLYLRLGSAR